MPCISSKSSNTSGNLSIRAPVDQRITYASIVVVYNYYFIFGLVAVITNIICLLVVLSKKHMREKYGSFGVLSFGDLINAIGMMLSSIVRTNLINGNAFVSLTSFECMGRPWPYFFIFGGQLPAFTLFFMGAERVLAVYRPLVYRTYVTKETKLLVNTGCIVLSVITLLVGIFFSYLNRNVCTNAFCTVDGATGPAYGIFNYIIIIFLPFTALLLNSIGYIQAKNASASANMRRELKKVFATLVIAALAVILSAIPNIILWGQGTYWNVPTVNISQLYIGFCCNSAIDLFAFTFLKADFRNRLLSMMSNGYLNRYFKLPDYSEETRPNQKFLNNILVRSANVTPISGVVEMAAFSRRPAQVRFQDIARRAAQRTASVNDSNTSKEYHWHT